MDGLVPVLLRVGHGERVAADARGLRDRLRHREVDARRADGERDLLRERALAHVDADLLEDGHELVERAGALRLVGEGQAAQRGRGAGPVRGRRRRARRRDEVRPSRAAGEERADLPAQERGADVLDGLELEVPGLEGAALEGVGLVGALHEGPQQRVHVLALPARRHAQPHAVGPLLAVDGERDEHGQHGRFLGHCGGDLSIGQPRQRRPEAAR